MRNNECDVCGGELRSGSTYGVCRRTPECRREYQRRYAIENREAISARMKVYMRQRRAGGEGR